MNAANQPSFNAPRLLWHVRGITFADPQQRRGLYVMARTNAEAALVAEKTFGEGVYSTLNLSALKRRIVRV